MITPREVAIKATTEAGKKILSLSKHDIAYSMKHSRDILSEADLASEKSIISTIKSYFPDHNVISEEAGEENNNSDHRWIIDPIDGTINFAKHSDEYAISLAYSYRDVVLVGLVYQPALNNLFIAEKGKGAFLNNKPLSVSSEKEVINCLAATDNTGTKEMQIKTFQILTRISTEVRHVRIFGSIALHLAKVAAGQLDFYFKPKLHYWDSAAGALLIEEAGGKVTDLAGNKFTENSEKTGILASNGAVHEKALKLLTEF
jgi:myo-inositol-1(or 4)-monophosphatase